MIARVPESVANHLKPWAFYVNQETTQSSKDDDEIDWVAIGRGSHEKEQEQEM